MDTVESEVWKSRMLLREITARNQISGRNKITFPVVDNHIPQ